MATWAFACRYHFNDLVAKVERTITPNDLQSALDAVDVYTDDMPGDSLALAAESLTRMLRRSNANLLQLAHLHTHNSQVLAKLDKCYPDLSAASVRSYLEPAYATACSHLSGDAYGSAWSYKFEAARKRVLLWKWGAVPLCVGLIVGVCGSAVFKSVK